MSDDEAKSFSTDEVDAAAFSELLHLVRRWQDEFDVRPSEVVRALLGVAQIVKPKMSK